MKTRVIWRGKPCAPPRKELRRPTRRLALPFVLWCAASLGGCATYTESFRPIELQLVAGRPDTALELLDKTQGDGQDQALYLLNRGMLLRMQDRFEESNAALEKAKALMDVLSAVSVTEQVGAFSINDGMRSYAGEPFEQVLLHLIKAFNYIELGQPDSARVEILQMDVKLRELAGQNEASAYREDAFARYLSGMLYEQLGDWNDATVAYRKAFETYTESYGRHFAVDVPPYLKTDLLRAAQRQGLADEVRRLRKLFGIEKWDDDKAYRRQGHVVVVLCNGLAPVKNERSISLQDLQTGRLHRVAIPYYQPQARQLSGFRLRAGDRVAQGAVVENIDAIARKTLDEQLPGIQARALARAVIKNKAVKKTSEQNGAMGALLNVATFVSERADTRNWRTLPSEIHLARLDLPPGRHDLVVEFFEGAIMVERQVYTGVELEAGKTRYFFEHRVLPAWSKGRRVQ